MDYKDLLQDLHFQLSNAGSGLTQSRDNIGQKASFLFESEDRTIMTEKWVAQVHKQNRQRSLSSDSYFRTVSVCDKLKKSFLKPCMVTEEDLEDLQRRISELQLEDSVLCSVADDQKTADIPDFNKNSNGSSERQVLRFRSKTAPLLNFCESSLKRDTDVSKTTEKLHCNLAAVQTVDLIKDTLLDENCNVISCQDCHPAKEVVEVVEKSNFRNESLFPSPEELKEKKHNKDISPNNIYGCYKNVESYLKTQFYLLREDFIRPLKEGIADYRYQLFKGVTPQDVKNLNLHHNVRVVEHKIRDNKLGIAIDMGFPLSEKIGEKNFMEGSLVLLTSNHFKDILVATVLSRQFLPRPVQVNGRIFSRSRRGRSNILIVQLHAASHFQPALTHQKFLLAESQAFFQPFYYVMKIFQGMALEDVPMQQHIIGSEIKKAISSPSYLTKDTKYLLESVRVEVLKDDWPKADVLTVNDSQLNALKAALCNELVLIQGPPGTGKTYLGCKVAKALLQNRQVWNREGNQPMLLMCQTNHALDQFMELLIPVTKKLMRIGCQSKSIKLGPYNIREWLKKGRRKTSSEATLQRNELKSVASNIRACHAELLKVASHGILDLQTLLGFGIINAKYSECFTNSENFLMWLEEEHYSKAYMRKHHTSTRMPANKERCFRHSPEIAVISMENEREIKCINTCTDSIQTEPNIVRGVVFKYVLSLSDLEIVLKKKNVEVKSLNHLSSELHNSCKILEDRLNFFQNKITGRNAACRPPSGSGCLWALSPIDRWSLYRYWVKQLEKGLLEHLESLEHLYMSISSAVDDLKQLEKLDVMRKAELVGMTTSAAARLYPVLRELHCPIAIVEEAAEVHESHIVATITKHCQHLILLGDHKQLRPRPASYALSKTHFTDVSLFERLALNKTVTINTLLTQHRMQPQISALIRPSIYSKLQDHQCTINRDHVLGFKKNVFFFTHRWLECRNILTGSFKNPDEAKMSVQLARYLVHEKYSIDDVCILTAYREQVSEIEENCTMYPELDGLRVLTIDNFQGEECKIVILSLVRNNSENKIGFLQIENRVCVALSRARDGLFMLGNIEMLARNSKLWSSVNKILLKSGSVGKSFPLECAQHPKETKFVSSAADFSHYIEAGGCQLPCMFRFPCDHVCRKKCHLDVKSHFTYRCQEACKKTCDFGHKCGKLCSDECGDCESITWKLLPCGHKALIKCSLDTSNYVCAIPIKKHMEPCSHSLVLQCWMPPISQKYCSGQCKTILKCGHRCPLRCNSLVHPDHKEMKCKCEDKSNIFYNRSLGKVQRC